jgi:catechol 2,3-dioxygenase-like lactoylglutathione lyase family enzyme
MSYTALVTDQYDEMRRFYGEKLGFPVVEAWDRDNARGVRFDIDGMRLELLDNKRERRQLTLGQPADRFHVVVEVDDVDATWRKLNIGVPAPTTVSWGARLFQLRDPDGVAVTFLQWLESGRSVSESIRGKVSTGTNRGQHFTQLDWAREQFIEKLEIDPFPGTLNLVLDDPDSKAAWSALRDTPGVRIDKPAGDTGHCEARCYRVRVAGRIDGAIVLPEVGSDLQNQIQIIAPIGLRNELEIRDGDEIVLELAQAGSPPVTEESVE